MNKASKRRGKERGDGRRNGECEIRGNTRGEGGSIRDSIRGGSCIIRNVSRRRRIRRITRGGNDVGSRSRGYKGRKRGKMRGERRGDNRGRGNRRRRRKRGRGEGGSRRSSSRGAEGNMRKQ